ncbi:MAG: NTP transferase domain-containing protein [Candidatus Komeilibacteria bacterium]|nr:NTP transferase domain-containing protein [Candidatus Komeilibacteria bacterium]
MDYKVCILTAGAGTRMGALSNNINKGILPVNFKAVISHVIEKFPKEVEIVIALGYKKETVKDYLALAHPERQFTFVEVDNYIGPGTGPGYSLLSCKAQLQSPFIFITADTLVLEDIPKPNQNWFGVAPIKETERYCTVKIKNNLIYQLDDKTKNDNKFAFIGLAGVKDFITFFDGLERNKEIAGGEIQVSNGFKNLIENKLVPIEFTWFDTGTLENYKETDKNFGGEKKKFDFSKGGGDEFLYFVNNRVIKFFADEKVSANRCLRAKTSLRGLCPEIEGHKNCFYSYKKIDGQTLYSILNRQIVKNFLQWAKINLWRKVELNENQKESYVMACKKFYIEKTANRLKAFYEKTGLKDVNTLINGVQTPSLKEIMDKIDWVYITAGIPSNFHGDLQFDNILVTKDPISNLEKFVLLDWRQDFAGLTDLGDLYYDLAKLYGGVLISYQLIKDGLFSFDMNGPGVYYNYHIKNDLIEAKEEYESFLIDNDFVNIFKYGLIA